MSQRITRSERAFSSRDPRATNVWGGSQGITSRHLNKVLRRVPVYLTLCLFVVLFAFPFYYLFVLATWPRQLMFTSPPRLWFGPGLAHNIHALFEAIPFHVNFFNSVGISVSAVVTQLFFCTMGGFAFAKYSFKGQNVLFSLILALIAVPPFLNIIPFFQMMSAFGWINTWYPLIVPMMANPFGIFLMTQFLKTSIPPDLMDAGRIDGMSEFGILLRVVFPLAKPAMSVLGIVTFVGTWNNFMGALVFLPNLERTTIPVALARLFHQAHTDYGAVMAGTAVSLLPIMLVFVFFSRRIISDLQAGALRG